MRRSELVRIQWRDVDLMRRVVLLRDTKNGTPRLVPLSTKAVEIFKALPRVAARVFTCSAEWVTRWFRVAVGRAELLDLRFHDLRHEAISRLFEWGKFTDMEIATITGHKTLSQLKRYTHLRAALLVDRMP